MGRKGKARQERLRQNASKVSGPVGIFCEGTKRKKEIHLNTDGPA